MENATKALLIAAAVLIAILIISLTLIIYRQGANSVTGANLSEAEAAEFNGKFTVFEGDNISTSKLNSLLETVFSHNKQERESGSERFVTLTVWGPGERGSILLRSLGQDSSTLNRLTGNSYYDVTCYYSGNIINSINVIKK